MPIPFPFSLADDLLDVRDGNRINAGERLIEQHERGTGGQGTGNFQPAAFSTGQRVGHARPDVSEVELVEQDIYAFCPLSSRVIQHFQNCQNIVLHGQPTKDRRLLRQIADTVPCTLVHRQGR